VGPNRDFPAQLLIDLQSITVNWPDRQGCLGVNFGLPEVSVEVKSVARPSQANRCMNYELQGSGISSTCISTTHAAD